MKNTAVFLILLKPSMEWWTICSILIPDMKTTAVFLILLMEWWTAWRESSALVQRSIFQTAFFHNNGGFEHIFNRKY